MEQYRGRTVVMGIGMGKIYSYTRDQYQIEKKIVERKDLEEEKYLQAEQKALVQLARAYEKAVEMVGAKSAAPFERQEILLREGAFGRDVRDLICTESVSAEYAVSVVGEKLTGQQQQTEENWAKEEQKNVKELVRRLLGLLKEEEESRLLGEEPMILAAKELSPGDLLQLKRSRIQGLLTETGSGESHTAVLAAAMQIPFLTGIPFRPEWNGKQAVVDGEKQAVILEPEPLLEKEIQDRIYRKKQEREELNQLVKEKAVTLDGERLYVYANIGEIGELEEVIRCRAAGIGLFRSEFLYMGRENYPSEEEQFVCYKTIVEKMQGRPVTIRTLDIGADKRIRYLRMDKEQNPAMGYRGIRFCLEQKELFRTQLKALYRAAAFGDLGVLYPMITSEEELDQIQEIIQDIQEEMDAKKLSYGKVRQGVLIETPAAAMISDKLAQRADFISIGTNDLIQYVMAADRQNPRVSGLCRNDHPAVIKMLEMIIQNSHRCQVPVTICGEMASDLSMTKKLVELGVDIISVTPAQILPVRQEVRSISVKNQGISFG